MPLGRVGKTRLQPSAAWDVGGLVPRLAALPELAMNDTTSPAIRIGLPGRVTFMLALATPLLFSLDYGPMPKMNSQAITVLLWGLWLLAMRLQGVRSMPTSATVVFVALLVVIGLQSLLEMFGYWSRVMLSAWQIAMAALITSLAFDPNDHDRVAPGSFLPLFGWALLVVVLWQIPVGLVQYFHLEPGIYAMDPVFGRLLTFALWMLPLLYFMRTMQSTAQRWQLALYWALGGVIFVVLWGSFIRYIEISGKPFSLSWLVSPSNPGDAMGNVRQRNQLASLCALGFVGLVFLYPRFKVWQHWLLAVLITLPLALTTSRTGTVHVLLLPLLWLFLLGRQALQRRWWPLLAAPLLYLAWSGIISVASVWLLSDVDNIFKRLHDVGTSMRWHYWPQVFQVFTANPVLGVGWGQLRIGMLDTNFHAATPQGSEVWEYIDHAHNLVLEFLAETGLVGFLVMLAGALVWLRHVWQLRAKGDYARHPWAAAALYGALVFLAHSMLEFPLWYCYFLFPTCLLLTLSVATEPAPERWQINSHYLTGFAALSVPLALWVFLSYQQARGLYYGEPNTSQATMQQRLQAVREGIWFPDLGDFVYVLSNPLDATDIEKRYALNERVLGGFTDPRLISQQITLACYMGGKQIEVLRRARYVRTAFGPAAAGVAQELVPYLNSPDSSVRDCIRSALAQVAPGTKFEEPALPGSAPLAPVQESPR